MASRHRMRHRLVGVLFSFVAGCGTLVGLVKVEQPATVVLVNERATIIAPDTVNKTAPFEAQFSSFENKCTDRVRDEVTVARDSVQLIAVVARSTQCGDALVLMPHTFHIQGLAPGRFRIYARGRRENSG